MGTSAAVAVGPASKAAGAMAVAGCMVADWPGGWELGCSWAVGEAPLHGCTSLLKLHMCPCINL